MFLLFNFSVKIVSPDWKTFIPQAYLENLLLVVALILPKIIKQNNLIIIGKERKARERMEEKKIKK